MRIVIDMQGAQVESRRQGKHSYSMELTKALVKNRGEHEIVLVLNGLFPDTIQPIRAAFHSLLPQDCIRVWHAVGPVSANNDCNTWRREVADIIRAAFIESLQPNVLFVHNFFEGYENDAVVSISNFTQNIITIVAVNSLRDINTCSDDPDLNNFYLDKLSNLKQVSLLLELSPLNEEKISQLIGINLKRIKPYAIFDGTTENLNELNIDVKGLIRIFEQVRIAAPALASLTLKPRLKMAYISPLPPERSGISDYSAELLPELAQFYDIDVIVNQEEITSPWITANCGVYQADWFLESFRQYDRVIYHFGNSHYHQHMFNLLAQVPGVVVLHDFYLSGAVWSSESNLISPFAFTRGLYASHDYRALTDLKNTKGKEDLVWKYPVNLDVLQQSLGVVVHSDYSRKLANDWYGSQYSKDWAVIPLLRRHAPEISRIQARQVLGIHPEDFVVCSFGLLGAAKLNQRLLTAWMQSSLNRVQNSKLVFVGENDASAYGTSIINTIDTNKLSKSVLVTGWVDVATYNYYLTAADVAVQLRTSSRGETSAAVLDCMNHSLPIIVNANGSIAELPLDSVWMLPDLFNDQQLIEALETLLEDSNKREMLGRNAYKYVSYHHNPNICAEKYSLFIEKIYASSKHNLHKLVNAISVLDPRVSNDSEYIDLADNISRTFPERKPLKQLFIDVSTICQNDLKTGIQRVVRSLVAELIKSPPNGFRTEPVYLTKSGGELRYLYARSWTSGELGIPSGWMRDEPIEPTDGDLMLVADFTGNLATEAEFAGVFAGLKNDGIALYFIIYDLLPIKMPEFFPPNKSIFIDWLNTVSRVADNAICISSTVAEELQSWIAVASPKRLLPLNIGWFHLGADVENSLPTRGLQKNASKKLAAIKSAPSFLMVGTIEPRKGYLQVLEAFTQMWLEGVNVNLVIVGNEGWKGLPSEMRRTIPAIIKSLRQHPELGNRLFWIEGASDEYLEMIYDASTCLIAASEGEGFGLPLIEAAQHKLPIIARDIPVFREVAGEFAYYFLGTEAEDLAAAIKTWLSLYDNNKHPSSVGMPWLTWKESTSELINQLPLVDDLKA